MSPGHTLAPGIDGVLLDGLHRAGVALGRQPDGQVPLAQLSGATQCRLGPATDDDWDRVLQLRTDGCVVDLEESAVTGHGLPGEQVAHDAQRLIHPAAAGGRIDAAHSHLVGIFTTDSDPEEESARGELSKRVDLPGDRDWVAEGQQVHGSEDLEVAQRGQRCGLDETVESRSTVERHVVAHAQSIDTGRHHGLHSLSQRSRTAHEHLVGHSDTEGDRR